MGGQAQGARRVPGGLRAGVRHRRRGGGKFFVFVVHVGDPGEQPHPQDARGRSDIDSQEGPSADTNDRGRTVHASPDNARAAATRAVHASPDDSGARTASFFAGAGELLPAQ